MPPLIRVRIIGPSMEPALRNGEWWLARRGGRLKKGDVALVRHPLRPHLVTVKRLDHRVDDGWWVLGDNESMSEDSRQYGPVSDADVVGRLVFRYRPLMRR